MPRDRQFLTLSSVGVYYGLDRVRHIVACTPEGTCTPEGSVITAECSDIPQDLLWRSREIRNRDLRSKLGLESVCKPLCRSNVAARYGGAARSCEVHGSYVTAIRSYGSYFAPVHHGALVRRRFDRSRAIPGSIDISVAQRMHLDQQILLTSC